MRPRSRNVASHASVRENPSEPMLDARAGITVLRTPGCDTRKRVIRSHTRHRLLPYVRFARFNERILSQKSEYAATVDQYGKRCFCRPDLRRLEHRSKGEHVSRIMILEKRFHYHSYPRASEPFLDTPHISCLQWATVTLQTSI